MAAVRLNEQAIFEVARKMDSDEGREAYLRQVCGDDAATGQRVRALLKAYLESANFLESPAAHLVATLDEPMRERPGTVIGPYKLLEQIGEGGFGVVFLAEQTQPVRRKVALKVLKPGMDTRQVVARFEAERQALAIMDHPNIAHVFDGGETASGRPYFVMELVKGAPITEFCDQNQLTSRQRLDLFVSVCQAVQHAHQKGVIHRDLKPSNVLVTRQDGAPAAKVIDFGIAKALGRELTDKTLFTGAAQMIGTPLYMSPEQAQQGGLDIDTRSDVYSLGVVLYELLTGATPFDAERLRQAPGDEMRRILREEEPPRPSTRVSTLGRAGTAAAAQRQTDPKRLGRLLRGELDWIVMKSLEKDRNRRYESASAFALDIGCYVADDPVVACPPSAWYRFRKFARRNRTALAVAGLVLFFIVVLGGGGGWVVRDRKAREEAATKERLDRERRLTTQVELILEDVDRLEREQKWPEAQAAARRADAVLAGGEAGDAIRRRVGDVRRDLDFVAALDRVRQDSAEFREEERFKNVARDYAQAFRDYGVDVEALPADEAIARLQDKPALAAPVAAALDDWVRVRRNLAEGEPSWKPLIAVARGLDPDPLRDRLRAVWGQPVTPELKAELLRLVESIDVKAQPPATLIALAGTLNRAQLTDAAIRIRQAGQHAYPGDFWLNVQLGLQLEDCKDYAGAVRYFSVAVSLRPDTGAASSNLGCALLDQGKVDGAIACFQKAIELDPKDARFHVNLADALLNQRKLDEAIAECRTAIELDPKLAAAHSNLGGALHGQGKDDDAIAEYHEALAADPTCAAAQNNLGVALGSQGKREEASLAFQEAIRIDPNCAPAKQNLKDTLWRLAAFPDPKSPNPARIVELAEKSVALMPQDGAICLALGMAQYRAGNWQAALESTEKATSLRDGGDPSDWLGLAMVHRKLGDEATAGQWYEKATQWIDKHGETWGDHLRLRAEAAEVLGRTSVLRSFKGHTDAIHGVALSADGSRAITCGFDGSLRRWKVDSGEEERCLKGHSGRVLCVALTPDGSRALSGGDDRTVRLWDVDRGGEIRQLVGHTAPVECVALSPDGKLAVSGGQDKTVRLWEVDTGKERRCWTGHTAGVRCVAFSPDGKQVLSGGFDDAMRLWSVETGEELRQFQGHGAAVICLAFSPDGGHILSGGVDKTLRLWDAKTGEEVRRFEGHTGGVECLALSADGRRAVSGADDATARVWDVETGKELYRFDGHAGAVWAVAFTPDGNRVLSGCGTPDGTVLLWELPPELRNVPTKK